jgi:hypothetical protein
MLFIMDNIIHNAESISLNKNDIIKICSPNNVKIMFYVDLNKCNDINELFNESHNIIILFRTEGNYGHWVSLLKYSDYIEFFDPYGFYPDSELKYASESLRSSMNTTVPHLTYLLNNAKNKYNTKLIYNAVKLQKLHKDINTCGRHVALRIKLRHIELHEYQKLLTTNKLNPDMIVTYLTYLLIDDNIQNLI